MEGDMFNDGYYNWNYEFSKGGMPKPEKSWRLQLKLSYSMRFSFNEDILGLKAVDLIRRHPTITDGISFHQYISAN